MTKRLYVILEDHEYNKLLQAKGNKTWKQFFLDLLDFKRKMEEEGEFLPRDSLKGPYVDLAMTLRKLGSLLKAVWKDEKGEEIKEGWELEAAALLPLYVAGTELGEEEERELLLLISAVIEEIVKKYYQKREEEIRWISQALRMLALDREEIYDMSIENLCERLRFRREHS
jgi:hypothetical protein